MSYSIFHIHGEDHSLRLHAHVVLQGSSGLHVSAQFLVPYVQGGMNDPSTLVLRVGKTVVIDVSSAAVVKP